jgi:hypothetical protein
MRSVSSSSPLQAKLTEVSSPPFRSVAIPAVAAAARQRNSKWGRSSASGTSNPFGDRQTAPASGPKQLTRPRDLLELLVPVLGLRQQVPPGVQVGNEEAAHLGVPSRLVAR